MTAEGAAQRHWPKIACSRSAEPPASAVGHQNLQLRHRLFLFSNMVSLRRNGMRQHAEPREIAIRVRKVDFERATGLVEVPDPDAFSRLSIESCPTSISSSRKYPEVFRAASRLLEARDIPITPQQSAQHPAARFSYIHRCAARSPDGSDGASPAPARRRRRQRRRWCDLQSGW